MITSSNILALSSRGSFNRNERVCGVLGVLESEASFKVRFAFSFFTWAFAVLDLLGLVVRLGRWSIR